MKKSIYFVAAILALAACTSKIEQPEVEPTQEPAPAQKTWSVTINANKVTKALADAGSSITATWTAGDEVAVWYGESYVGDLTAATDGPSTTFTGTITGDYTGGESLTLKYAPGSGLSAQNGTLAYIAANCDNAAATVTITNVSGGVLTISDADFQSSQAITKFALLKTDGTTPLVANSVIVTADGLGVEVKPSGTKRIDITCSSLSEIYVALSNTSGAKKEYLFIITEAGTGTKYYATKKVNLANGNYYQTSLVAKGTIAGAWDLSGDSNMSYTIPDNYIVYQSNPSVNKNMALTLADGYSAILFNVHIAYTYDLKSALTCTGTANIHLLGDNYLKGKEGSKGALTIGSAGIETQGDPGFKTVTFTGPGNLESIGGVGAAGIGGTALQSSGHVYSKLVFDGTGTITATSLYYGAGIGSGIMYNPGGVSGLRNSIGSITINSGTIIASSGYERGRGGAGIGAGHGAGTSSKTGTSSCGNIIINGGNVTATGGYNSAGIGSGYADIYSFSTCGNIEINGGTVSATGGNYAAGIGSSAGYSSTYYCQCGTVAINSGITSVTATRGSSLTDGIKCIGAGYGSAVSICGEVTIADGLIDSGQPSGKGLVRTITAPAP